MNLLQQSVAVSIGLGPFLDDTDGKTIEDVLTIAQADVRLKKNDGNWAQKNQASSAVNDEENGWYEIQLDTTDTNTLGQLIVAVHKTGVLPVWREFMVVPLNVYQSLVLGVEFLETTDLKQDFGISGTTLTAKKTDGATTQFTRTITTNAAADPIVGLD
jgi:hypothetical protein